MLECIDACTEGEECSLQYSLPGEPQMCGILKVDISIGIPVLYDSKLFRQVVVGVLERIEHCFQCLLLCPPRLSITDCILEH